ncbi:MAG TPA: glycoside hydrolase family 16 protein, partial [Polyangia bacterium]|nr:glycoside hydrolase family 16 protein [Polyangia bacterium]
FELSMVSTLLMLGLVREAAAADLVWKGHTWKVTSGGMAGVCQGDPKNVTVDANGYLHFKITNAGGTWTASEMFTTDELGFGTYQWQVDGPIDKYDKNIVLGLFPYGPAAGIGPDGTNEIDIEYSRWGQANGVNGDWTDYPSSGKTIGELSYDFSLDSTLSTSRLVWTNASIQSSLIGGLQPVDGTTGLIKTWTYAPQNAATNIPQNPMPLGMNLWCFDAPPSNGQPIEIVIRDFQFIPESASGADGGAAEGGATGGAGGASGGAGMGADGGAGRQGLGGSSGAGGSVAGSAGASGADRGGVDAAAGAELTGAGGQTMGAGGGVPSGGAGASGAGGAARASSGGCAVSGPGDAGAPGFVFLMMLASGRVRRRARTPRPASSPDRRA